MFDFSEIKEITKNASQNIKLDSNGDKIKSTSFKIFFHVWRWIIPLFIASFPWWAKISLQSIENFIGTGIAIFTGLFFSLLLNTGDKIRNEKLNKDRDNDQFQRYKENMKQIAHITLHSISLGIIIFLLMMLHVISGANDTSTLAQIFSSLILFLSCRFIFTILCLLQRFKYVVEDEIENIL